MISASLKAARAGPISLVGSAESMEGAMKVWIKDFRIGMEIKNTGMKWTPFVGPRTAGIKV
jgi:hypothetical protein